MATDMQTGNEPSLASLVKGIIDDVQILTKQQLELLKQELKEDASKTAHAAMPLVVGGVVSLIGLLLLGHALAWALVTLGLHTWVAYLIVGGAITGLGVALVFMGLAKFRTFNPLPDRSLEALKENVECLTHPDQRLTNPK
jgi:uncharacterized membrane protein YqjE